MSLEIVKSDGSIVLYERYGTSIRRRVNGTGHEIVLQNVKEMECESLGRKVIIEVELINGKKEKRLEYQMAQLSQ
ncbi:competence type IV pilus minor pilin ComGF [Guptibacillus hwajinpoensis]|uniref:competence type IV pilus minor pilin ComGF n=1 Tax=Guptibacillus hwajinpoensis TaxID=208199 RepID=UPI003D6B3929